MRMAVVEYIEPGLVRGRIEGEFDIEDAKQAFVEILAQVEQHKASKVLIDTRTVGGEPKVIERFFYGEFVGDAVNALSSRGWVGETPQFAYIMVEPLLDPMRLGETVALNRGMNVKSFEDENEALEWLGIS
jgi:hypothetical protein